VGRIISSFFISLDGVVEKPETWHMPYFDDEMGAIIGAQMETNAAFLMGRTLYDEWSAYWTQSSDDIAAYFNDIPKLVVSSSLQDPTWNNTTVVRGDVDAVRKAKQGIDGDIAMSGSATTVRWLLSHGLLDELRLLLHPVVVGHGQKLFEPNGTQKLDLVDSSALSTGVVSLRYRAGA
jgi:dihydrofolate reductase